MQAGSTRVRRGGVASAALVGAVAFVAVTAAVAVGTRVASTRALPSTAHHGSSAYARDAIGHLAPVDAHFVERRVGKVPGTRATTSTTTAPARPRPAPRPAAPGSIKGRPGAFPGLAPGGWVLTVQMVPNANTVRSGEEIRYRMVVTNTGTDEFRGRSFRLEWHTPNGTLGRNALAQCGIVQLAVLRALCESQRLLVSPGLGEARHERFDSQGFVVIPAGGSFTKDWFVSVLPSNAAGSTIFNHAHLTVNINGKDARLRTPDVVVTVVA